MNKIFKYNASTKYSTKDLKGGYNSNNFPLLDVYLYEKPWMMYTWMMCTFCKNSAVKYL